MLDDADGVEGDWLVALEQQAGKGRQGRKWISAKGNFYGSTLVRLRSDDPAPQTLSLAAGLALIEAVDGTMAAQPLMLKWPNDLMLAGRKLGGILLERSGDRIAVGIGVNLAASPKLPGRQAADLGGAVSPQAFAPLVAGSFARLLALWRSNESSALTRAWEQRAHPLGAGLTVHASRDEILSGCFDGLESDGALRLRRDDGGLDIIRAGDVDLG